jgi:hypothetical protein
MGGYQVKILEIAGNAYDIPIDAPHFGLELEVEEARVPSEVSTTLWTTVHDGSLRDNGVEFLSRRPMTRAEVERSVPIFYEWRDRYNFQDNIRTSTHVHVNVLGKTAEQVAAICAVYTLVEPLLFRYCGRLREENIYCVPWYRATQELESVRHLHKGEILTHMACKYSALFLEPLIRFGTLEFRHAPIFQTAGELLTWVDICERIVESGFETIEDVLECFEELSAEEFVEGLFGIYITRVLRGVCDMDFEELMEFYDVQTTAEIPLACTYKPTEWFTPDISVAGEGTDGYHRHIPTDSYAPMELYSGADIDDYEYEEEEY